MTKVTQLSVHRNTREKRQRRQVWQEAQGKARAMPKDVDGFAMVYFRHAPDRTGLTVRATYFVRDAADADRLPGIVGNEMQRCVLRAGV